MVVRVDESSGALRTDCMEAAKTPISAPAKQTRPTVL
jgi:hypothetical protein